MHARLAARDPGAAATVHPNDRRRVVRALELVEVGASLRPSEDRLWGSGFRHPTLVVGLEVSRDELARRIAERTRSMLAAGAADEARQAAAGDVSETARHVIGLRELVELPEEEAGVAIELRTRRYAAYQRKWMRRIPDLVSLRADRPAGEIADEILEVARARQLVSARRAG
jgi:tRNA dimethylallyltransferase